MHDTLSVLLRCRFSWMICCAAIASVFCGCGQSGPKYWPVSGKVTFQDKPVLNASIRFSNPEAGTDVVMQLDADGKYAVTGEKNGLPEGTYLVAVNPVLNYDNVKTTPSGIVIQSSMPSRYRADIPRKYNNLATSGLTMTVKPEPNVFDVDMQ